MSRSELPKGVHGVKCAGRMSDQFSRPIVTRLERREDGSLFVRVDDPFNPATWIEVTLPGEVVNELERQAE
jgi:hypothetical protein